MLFLLSFFQLNALGNPLDQHFLQQLWRLQGGR
jgi:hypothetical protein